MILSRYKNNFPGNNATDKQRRIGDGPLYSFKEISALLGDDDHDIRTVTNKCRLDIRDLNFDDDELALLILEAIRNGKFKGSWWCELDRPGVWAACDSYHVSRSETVPYARQPQRIDYYVKFALGREGVLLLLVSCHLS